MHRKFVAFAIVMLMILVWVQPAASQETTTGWEQLETSNAPSRRFDHALVATGEHNSLVLFGGRTSVNLNETWILDLGTLEWRQIQTDLAPSPRSSLGAAYDPKRERVLIFGGRGDGLFNDTWAFDLNTETWQDIITTGTPPGVRYGTSAVVDTVEDRLLVSHGFAQGRYDDTLALDLETNTWTDVTPLGDVPQARCLHDAVYDPTTEQMLLFGGCSSPSGPCPQGDLWSFQDDTWAEQLPDGDFPPARQNTSLLTNGEGFVWLFGGATANGIDNDLWQLDVETGLWEELDSAISPPVRSHHRVVWDANGERIILFGGQEPNGLYNDVWAYTPDLSSMDE